MVGHIIISLFNNILQNSVFPEIGLSLYRVLGEIATALLIRCLLTDQSATLLMKLLSTIMASESGIPIFDSFFRGCWIYYRMGCVRYSY